MSDPTNPTAQLSRRCSRLLSLSKHAGANGLVVYSHEEGDLETLERLGLVRVQRSPLDTRAWRIV